MKIGILLCGLSAPSLYEKYGYYDQLFAKLLQSFDFEFVTFWTVHGELPKDNDDCDGYIISGSKHNLDEELEWMAPLLAWTRSMYGSKPMVGVCFGHQVIAKALGGRVVKAEVVHQTGIIEYHQLDGRMVSISAWHEQQIAALPPVDLQVTASAEHCPIASIIYANKAISYQAHPEFDEHYMADLYAEHRARMSQAANEFYQSKLGVVSLNHEIGQEIANFFRTNI